MARVFSGIQPTGEIHIGNYFGAIQNYVKLGNQFGKEAIFCVVDYHAITIPYDAEQLAPRTFEATLVNMAAGLDPDRVVLFAQSHVREHSELAWVFTTQTPLGDLERMTQFKDKSSQHGGSSQQSVPAGLLMYPVLMAADILLYKADTVPVGEDQNQHLELTREIARRFNHRYGETFPEPKAVHAEGALRVPGIDGQGKMSKSKGNTIGVLEEMASIWAKIRVAPTDPARVRRTDPGDPHRCIIWQYHRLFNPQGIVDMVEVECARAGIGCVECKKVLMDGIERTLTTVQDRAASLRRDPERVHGALARGAAEARAIAAPVMDEVREKIGLYRAQPVLTK